MNLRIKINAEIPPVELPAGIQQLDATVNADGTVTVTADPEAFARLGGRKNFGSAAPIQSVLLDRIATAWHDAGCRESS